MTSDDQTTRRASAAGDAAEREVQDDAGGTDETTGEAASETEGYEAPAESRAGAGGLDAEAAALQADLDTLNDRHLRLAAEFDNFRRRAQSEMRGSWERAQADLVRRLVDSLDDLERVGDLDPETTTVPAILEGIGLVERKLMRALEEAGVEAIQPTGEPFNPESMEAVMRVPAETEQEDDHVDQVFQKGYRLKGQLVRPARVSVRKFD